ncbi:MAG: translation elongation factor Ts [Phycisphaerae bacterium]|nr:translation elongation factor Ts [Phycisphaerae bacterium]
MAEITAKAVMDLREQTGQGMMACKQALAETGGDVAKAIDLLRTRGKDVAIKKASRATKEGRIGSYIHHTGKLGVMIEVNCETDFVAKGDLFTDLVKDLCMQIASANPEYLKREDVPGHVLAKEQEIFREQVKDKPAPIQDKIIAGKMDKWFGERCLLEQLFVKDDSKSIKDVLTETVTKTGENISVARFVRFSLGETA